MKKGGAAASISRAPSPWTRGTWRLLRLLHGAVTVAFGLLLCVLVAHQVLQFGARFLPSTPGTPSARTLLASPVFSSVYGRGFRVPATQGCALSDTYRYTVGALSYEARHLHLAFSPKEGDCDAVPLQGGPVHYLPWAPQWAMANPGPSLLLWLYLLFAGAPIFWVLWRPSQVAATFLRLLARLPRLPRR